MDKPEPVNSGLIPIQQYAYGTIICRAVWQLNVKRLNDEAMRRGKWDKQVIVQDQHMKTKHVKWSLNHQTKSNT